MNFPFVSILDLPMILFSYFCDVAAILMSIILSLFIISFDFR